MPWLDTRKLAPEALPRPWERGDFERDLRRAGAAELELAEEMWSAYAEQGLDAVTVLLDERREARLGPLRQQRAQGLALAKERAVAPPQDVAMPEDASFVRFAWQQAS